MVDDRTFIKVHDTMPDHPKVIGLSDAAFRLLVTMWCWSGHYHTDGVVTYTKWNKEGSKKARDELFAVGLAKATDAGVVMHDFLDWQRSAADVADLIAKRRTAGAKGGKQKANNLASARANGVASARPVAKQTLEQTPSKPGSKPASKSVADKEKEEVPNGTSVPNASHSAPGPNEIVAAWVDAFSSNDVKPSAGMKGQVAKLSAELIKAGNDPHRVLAAAQQAGAKGFATIDRELGAMNGRATVTPIRTQRRDDNESWMNRRPT